MRKIYGTITINVLLQADDGASIEDMTDIISDVFNNEPPSNDKVRLDDYSINLNSFTITDSR